jgi:flagellar export protein FliJ
MKTYATLLKMAQGRMDALGLEAARMVERIDQLKVNMTELAARGESEALLAVGDLSLAPFMPAYQARVKQEMSTARTSVEEAEASLVILRAQLTEAWREKSKFEQLIERAKLAGQAAETALENAQLDEAAVNRVGR